MEVVASGTVGVTCCTGIFRWSIQATACSSASPSSARRLQVAPVPRPLLSIGLVWHRQTPVTLRMSFKKSFLDAKLRATMVASTAARPSRTHGHTWTQAHT
eukprot:171404-Chlamydomonas_euryale.AAC.1